MKILSFMHHKASLPQGDWELKTSSDREGFLREVFALEPATSIEDEPKAWLLHTFPFGSDAPFHDPAHPLRVEREDLGEMVRISIWRA